MKRNFKIFILLVFACVMAISIVNLSTTAYAVEEGQEHLDESWDARTEIPRMVNFLIIVVLLWFVLRKPLAGYFSNRREQIQKMLEDAIRAKDEAEAKVEGYRQKISNLEQEVAAIKAESDRQSEVLSRNLREETDKAAERLTNQARVNIELERKKAADSLNNQASLLALELAETLLKQSIGPEDLERINRECIEGLDAD
jgi:F-type H+-transporting ATPase subunit b